MAGEQIIPKRIKACELAVKRGYTVDLGDVIGPRGNVVRSPYFRMEHNFENHNILTKYFIEYTEGERWGS